MLKLMLTPTFCTGMVATMLTPTTPLLTATMSPTWAMVWDTTCPTSMVTMPTQDVRTTWEQLSPAFREEEPSFHRAQLSVWRDLTITCQYRLNAKYKKING